MMGQHVGVGGRGGHDVAPVHDRGIFVRRSCFYQDGVA